MRISDNLNTTQCKPAFGDNQKTFLPNKTGVVISEKEADSAIKKRHMMVNLGIVPIGSAVSFALISKANRALGALNGFIVGAIVGGAAQLLTKYSLEYNKNKN